MDFLVSVILLSGALSPVLAFMYKRGFLPGGVIKGKFIEIIGEIKEARVRKGCIIAKKVDGKYIGITGVQIGTEVFSEGQKSAEGLYTKSVALGKILCGSDSRIELRFHSIPLSLSKIEKTLEKELESLRALIKSEGARPELRDREKRISLVLERIKKGEGASWIVPYMLIYTSGENPDEVERRAIQEAKNIVLAIRAALGIKAFVCSSRQLASMLKGLFLSPPRLKGSIRLSEDPLVIPIPAIELQSLSPHGIFLGYRGGTRVPFLYDIRKYGTRHVLVIGPTGKGKTTLLATLANRVYARGIAPLLIIDPKGDMDVMVSRSIKRAYVCSETTIPVLLDNKWSSAKLSSFEASLDSRLFLHNSGLVNCIRELSDVISSTENVLFLLNNLTDEGRFLVTAGVLRSIFDWFYLNEPYNELRKIVIIDEAWRSTEASVYLVKRLVKESRSFGVSLVLSTQSVSDIPKDVLSNFGTLIVFGGTEISYIEAVSDLFGREIEEIREDLLRLGIGQALVKLPELSSLVQIDIDPESFR